MEKIIYQFWTGSNQMSYDRQMAFNTNSNIKNVNIKLITPENINEYILNEYPLHEAYKYLSCIHKSDYLRCYFMKFYGGGYADIKHYSINNNWSESFDIINHNENIDIIGQREIIGGSPLEYINNLNQIHKVTANGYFIVRKGSQFINLWYDRLITRLNEKLEILKNNPAQDAFGTNKNYPLRWAELCGELKHATEYDMYHINNEKINRSLISGVNVGIKYR